MFNCRFVLPGGGDRKHCNHWWFCGPSLRRIRSTAGMFVMLCVLCPYFSLHTGFRSCGPATSEINLCPNSLIYTEYIIVLPRILHCIYN